MNKKQEFLRDKDWYITNWDWYINGSYGEEGYQQALREYNEAQRKTEGRKAQTLRRIVINSFTNLVATELDCSYGYAQKLIVDSFTTNELDKLNKQFISELDELFK